MLGDLKSELNKKLHSRSKITASDKWINKFPYARKFFSTSSGINMFLGFMLQWSPCGRIFNERSCARCQRHVRNRIRQYKDVKWSPASNCTLPQEKWPAEFHLVGGWWGPRQVWTWWRGTGKSTTVMINIGNNYILFTHQQMQFLLNLEKFKFTWKYT